MNTLNEHKIIDDNRVREFTYVNNKGEIKERKVYVIHDDDTYLCGFDLKYLTKTEEKLVRKVFDTIPITPKPTEPTSINYIKLGVNQSLFTKAYRTFLKEQIA